MISIIRNILSILGIIIFISIFSLITIIIAVFTCNSMKASDIVKPLMGKTLLWICGIKLEVFGQENIPKTPAIFIGNHQSLLDIFIFPSILPKKTFAIGKKEMLRYPFLGWMFYISGQIPVDRSNHIRAMRSMEKVYDKINKHKYSVFFCPEGTRSIDGKLLPFKKGAFHLAIQTKLPIVPMIVFNAYKHLKKGSIKIIPGILKVKILPPIQTSHWKKEELVQRVDEVRNLFVRELSIKS